MEGASDDVTTKRTTELKKRSLILVLIVQRQTRQGNSQTECLVARVLTEPRAARPRVEVIALPETSSCATNAFAFQSLPAPIARAVPSPYLLSFLPKARFFEGNLKSQKFFFSLRRGLPARSSFSCSNACESPISSLPRHRSPAGWLCQARTRPRRPQTCSSRQTWLLWKKSKQKCEKLSSGQEN